MGTAASGLAVSAGRDTVVGAEAFTTSLAGEWSSMVRCTGVTGRSVDVAATECETGAGSGSASASVSVMTSMFEETVPAVPRAGAISDSPLGRGDSPRCSTGSGTTATGRRSTGSGASISDREKSSTSPTDSVVSECDGSGSTCRIGGGSDPSETRWANGNRGAQRRGDEVGDTRGRSSPAGASTTRKTESSSPCSVDNDARGDTSPGLRAVVSDETN
jgi:hypothetical protein